MMKTLDRSAEQVAAVHHGRHRPARRHGAPAARSQASTCCRAPIRACRRCPTNPTILDFFRLRFRQGGMQHLLQSANLARKNGFPEKIITACLLHDIGVAGFISGRPRLLGRAAGRALRRRGDHLGHPLPPGAALLSRRVGRLHRTPSSTSATSAPDYKPEPYIEQAYKEALNHKWYMTSRLICVNDLYAFDPNVVGAARRLRGHAGPQLQATRGRPGLRQQPRGAHVAHAHVAHPHALSEPQSRLTMTSAWRCSPRTSR